MRTDVREDEAASQDSRIYDCPKSCNVGSGSGVVDVVSVQELAARLKTGEPGLQLVDVREAAELEIVAIPGAIHLPLSQFQQWQGEIQAILDPSQETWALCHHGVRSAQFCYWLQQQGYAQVKNIAGGIDAYVVHVEPAWPRY